MQRLRDEINASIDNSLTISIVDHAQPPPQIQKVSIKSEISKSKKDVISDEIYSEMEVTYLANLIKKKIDRNKTMPIAELAGIFKKGLRTIEKLMKELLLQKAWETIKDHYKETKQDTEMINTCLKLLLRSKMLYNAKSDVVEILKKVKRIEKIKREIMPGDDGQQQDVMQSCDMIMHNYSMLVEWSERTHQKIAIL